MSRVLSPARAILKITFSHSLSQKYLLLRLSLKWKPFARLINQPKSVPITNYFINVTWPCFLMSMGPWVHGSIFCAKPTLKKHHQMFSERKRMSNEYEGTIAVSQISAKLPRNVSFQFLVIFSYNWIELLFWTLYLWPPRTFEKKVLWPRQVTASSNLNKTMNTWTKLSSTQLKEKPNGIRSMSA